VGRSFELSSEKVWAFDESGRPGKVVDYTFSSEEGRRLVKGAIAEVGLEERMPWSAKAPLIFAVVVLVLTLGGLAVAAALGQLS
jgi:hypothetical protein